MITGRVEFTTEMARNWAAVQTLVRRVEEELAELGESEADGGSGLICDRQLLCDLKNLWTSLGAMFASEESEETHMLEACPHLTDRLDTICRKHKLLSEMILTIEDLCDDEEPVDNWSDVERQFRRFVAALTAHQHADVLCRQSDQGLNTFS